LLRSGKRRQKSRIVVLAPSVREAWLVVTLNDSDRFLLQEANYGEVQEVAFQIQSVVVSTNGCQPVLSSDLEGR